MNIIVGCGYLGREVCKLLPDRDVQSLCCVVRTQASAELLHAHALPEKCIDLDQLDDNFDWPELSHSQLYFFAPPSATDEYDHRMRTFLRLCQHHTPRRIVYISTSGVYGDCQGAWVDENMPCKPLTARAQRRYDAEQALMSFCESASCEYMILRVGGIYGPERLPLTRLQNIKVIDPAQAPYSNRIHISDLAHTCIKAMQAQCHNQVFNVADQMPTSMSDYFIKLADFAGLPAPECVPLAEAHNELSPAMLSFINESRRMRTTKMTQVLKIKLRFPDLHSGLTDCFAKLNTP